MIDVYYWPTPNGHKIRMFVEETGIAYRIDRRDRCRASLRSNLHPAAGRAARALREWAD